MFQNRKTILERYERDAQGRLVIDVSAAKADDLYSDFEKFTPYVRRDLEPDLEEYLIECAHEISPAPFVLRFSLGTLPDAEGCERHRVGIRDFFIYLQGIERRKIGYMLRRFAVLLLLGFILLAISIRAGTALSDHGHVAARLASEGLTVAAWVTLWEALAILIIEWFPHRKNLKIFRRLARAEIILRQAPDVERPSA